MRVCFPEVGGFWGLFFFFRGLGQQQPGTHFCDQNDV